MLYVEYGVYGIYHSFTWTYKIVRVMSYLWVNILKNELSFVKCIFKFKYFFNKFQLLLDMDKFDRLYTEFQNYEEKVNIDKKINRNAK